jgi:hypothetical protein
MSGDRSSGVTEARSAQAFVREGQIDSSLARSAWKNRPDDSVPEGTV